MSIYTKVNQYALAAICFFAGVATTFVGFWDLRKITTPGRETEYMDYIAMVGVTSLGLAMLALCFLLLFPKNWAGFVAITFIGVAVVAFTIGAFHTNVFFGVFMVIALLLIIFINLRTTETKS